MRCDVILLYNLFCSTCGFNFYRATFVVLNIWCGEKEKGNGIRAWHGERIRAVLKLNEKCQRDESEVDFLWWNFERKSGRME